MPVSEISANTLAALNDTELEILRLLANGHTAKSIAARLGRSETAINERLREARRKTGMGSSRELARLLVDRKIWDENIDLAMSAASADSPAWPPQAGRQRTRGAILMLILLPIAAAGLLYAASASNEQREASPTTMVASPAASLLVGRWSLDTGRIPEAERPRKVTIDFRASAEGKWETLVEIVAPDGSVSRARSAAALDGVPVQLEGTMPFIDSVALRQPSPDTLVMTLAKGGKRVSTRVYTVASDGRSMTETIIWAGDGIPALPTTHFTRIG